MHHSFSVSIKTFLALGVNVDSCLLACASGSCSESSSSTSDDTALPTSDLSYSASLNDSFVGSKISMVACCFSGATTGLSLSFCIGVTVATALFRFLWGREGATSRAERSSVVGTAGGCCWEAPVAFRNAKAETVPIYRSARAQRMTNCMYAPVIPCVRPA